MKRIEMLAIVVALVVGSGCKKTPAAETIAGSGDGSAAMSGSGTPSAPADAATSPDAAAVAPSGPFVLPTGGQTLNEHEARKADATALGAEITLRFVDKMGEDNDGTRHVDEMLVLTGSSSLIVEIAYDSDDAAPHKGAAVGSLVTNAPLSPARPFGKDDAKEAPNPLPFKGPLLYLRHGAGGTVAVARDGDTIVAWRLTVLHGEGADGTVLNWFTQANIKLAPGAKVTAN
jgi:hypothetical protein